MENQFRFKINENEKTILISKITDSVYFLDSNGKVIRIESITDNNNNSAIAAENNSAVLPEFDYSLPRDAEINDDAEIRNYQDRIKETVRRERQIFVERVINKEITPVEGRIIKVDDFNRLKFEIDLIILDENKYEVINNGYKYIGLKNNFQNKECEFLYSPSGKFYQILHEGKILAF